MRGVRQSNSEALPLDEPWAFFQYNSIIQFWLQRLLWGVYLQERLSVCILGWPHPWSGSRGDMCVLRVELLR